MQPTYDVIFPICSIAPSTYLSIESALSQTAPYSCFIAIIDCVPEKSQDILSALRNIPRLITLFSVDFNVTGAGPCRQLGINHSCSDFVAFLDSDDIWHHQKSELQLSSLIVGNRKFSFTSYLAVNEYASKVIFASPVYLFRFTHFLLLFFNPIANSSVIACRSVLQASGGYSNLLVRNDFQTWIRLLSHLSYGQVSKRNEFLCLIAKREGSLSSKSKSSILSFFPLYKSLGYSSLLSLILSFIFAINFILLTRTSRYLSKFLIFIYILYSRRPVLSSFFLSFYSHD
ncbi:glycosyltransferase family 2 protein [bacterium]|nr:glycosyltransferase family 2 protein [bacterium]